MNKKINKFTIFLLSKMHFVNRLITIKTLIKEQGARDFLSNLIFVALTGLLDCSGIILNKFILK